jgi:hypothetical protein
MLVNSGSSDVIAHLAFGGISARATPVETLIANNASMGF